MLSPDELKNGMTFVLQLDNAGGERVQWIETLRGETARHWYEIYRRSDWPALRAEAADIFHRRVTETEAEAVRSHRCIFIHPAAVKADELSAGRGSL
jgi:hypothetical protein